ncbi:hypothetical protein HZC30_02450 [Candidatus Woesearchaeota archaeon]|nr:hypothetical protein [Candidatus Woesearchaeota archaeon]
MAVLQMKKGTGIDDLVRDYVPERVEEKAKIESGSNKFSELYRKYEKLLDSSSEPIDNDFGFVEFIEYPAFLDSSCDWEKLTFLEVLTPTEINLFLQGMMQYEEHRNYSESRSGLLVSKLIQNSYYAGHNNFSLGLGVIEPFSRLASGLVGTKEDPLHINLIDLPPFDTFLEITLSSRYCIFDLGNTALSTDGKCNVDTSRFAGCCAFITSNPETFKSLQRKYLFKEHHTSESYLYFQQSDGILILFKLEDYQVEQKAPEAEISSGLIDLSKIQNQ